MSEVSKVHTGPSIHSNVTHAKGVKSAYRTLNTKQCYSCQRCRKCIQGPSIQSNVTHVKGVKTSSIYTIRAVVICMSKVSKVAQYTL